MKIYLGTAVADIYEKNGTSYLKILPIFGMKLNFMLDAKLSDLELVGNTVKYDAGFFKLSIEFQSNTGSTSKVRMKPVYFWALPFGVTFGEISSSQKKILFEAIRAC